ncbi:MAG: fatty acid cis/trans isomerase [Deltaproteobacteria bacterium]|nr:fatty acid cis/trans isomerase [Candidatus Tharpella aukensis]
MRKYLLPLLPLLLLLTACGAKALAPVVFEAPSRRINYLSEIKPILDKRCVVCHSCYNSPCQLKFSSYEGVDRGATKKKIYDGTRLTTMDPTRLFIDAQSTEEWRQKDFFTVTESTAEKGHNNSTMLQLLSHKMKHPKSVGEYFSEENDLTCSATGIELGGYLAKHPNQGMPFGFPPLTKEEFNLIAGWLSQGAKGPTLVEQAALVTPSATDQLEINKWGNFLNRADAKHAMTARYLYEHLFLAQIRFSGNDYYELLRSTTPAGEPVELINTVRPYDDPKVEVFYYRFRKIHATIVHKTHMVFALNDAVLARFKELFITPDWLQKPHRMSYEQQAAANPFLTFEQIPPRSRYQFLLDNSTYVIRTFIRGPVCKGQIALNVINDHFWVMFLDPDHDLSVQYPGVLKFQKDNLRMPIEKGSDFKLVDVIRNSYQKDVVNYYQYRQDFYMTHNYKGMGYEAVWPGNRAADAPLLTIYRHFDSGTVRRGALGNLPRTMWVIDYPLFERIYYALVAGFDVFGNAGHQLMVRRYMDALRVEGESNLLEFMPGEKRRNLMQAWNKGIKLDSLDYYNSAMPAQISFSSDDPKREFIEHLIKHHFRPDCEIRFDPVNYMAANQLYPELPKEYKTTDHLMQGFRATARPGTAMVKNVNNHNANLAYVRIRVNEKDDRDDVVISIVVNRWHDNVAVMFSEDENLNPELDNIDFIEGFIGSYPNYFFDVKLKDLPEFLQMMNHFETDKNGMEELKKFGVNRADDNFWDYFDWFQKRFFEEQPIQAGLFDLNRYYFKAYE